MSFAVNIKMYIYLQAQDLQLLQLAPLQGQVLLLFEELDPGQHFLGGPPIDLVLDVVV